MSIREDDASPPQPMASLAPPDPPSPRKTWRGTVVIVSFAAVFFALAFFVLFRWKELQSFSPELRFEGVHRFSGTFLSPLPVAGSDLIKLRVLNEAGRQLVLPAITEPGGAATPLASYPPGTCVEGHVRHHRGYIAEFLIILEGTVYFFDEDVGWTVGPLSFGTPSVNSSR